MDSVPKVSFAVKSGVQVNEEMLNGVGVETTDYGTINRDSTAPKPPKAKSRPGYARQDSNFSSVTDFKEPQW